MDTSDGDNSYETLRPVDRLIMQYARTHPFECFCWLEFASKYNNNTIRNAFSRLAKRMLLARCCRSTNAYYISYETKELGQRGEKVTVTHMGGKHGRKQMQRNYLNYIESFGWEEIWRVHDVCLLFSVDGLYEKMLLTGSLPEENSEDITFFKVTLQGTLSLSIILHRTGSVTCYAKCSRHPIEVTPEGLADFTAVLGKLSLLLEIAAGSSSFVYKRSTVPDVSNWIVVQWHFGRDGKKEISGKSYHTTYRNWSGALVRVYLKENHKKFRARKEVIEQPNKTLPDAFSEKIAGNEAYRPVGMEDDNNA